jgi:hypothetical protein
MEIYIIYIFYSRVQMNITIPFSRMFVILCVIKPYKLYICCNMYDAMFTAYIIL